MLDNMVFVVYNRTIKEVTCMSKTDPRNTNNSLIARKRKERGLTQAQLAEMLGCHSKDISEWESGKRQPRADYMVKIATALGCTVDDIVFDGGFQYDDRGRLIVDRVVFSFKYVRWVMQVNGKWYLPTKDSFYSSGVDFSKTLKVMPYFVESNETCKEDGFPGMEVMLSCPISPREIPDGRLKIGRAISPKELEELCKKYSITDDNISKEYETARYQIYGKDNIVCFTAKQFCIGDPVNAITEENRLRGIGVEASVASAGFIEIRIK